MTFVILVLIVAIIYIVYKKLWPGFVISSIKGLISEKEAQILKKIGSIESKNHTQVERNLLESGKKNFIRLSERFKHNETKLDEVMKDWADYTEAIDEMLNVLFSNKTSDEKERNKQELFIKIEEIQKRSKDLLGDEYE